MVLDLGEAAAQGNMLKVRRLIAKGEIGVDDRADRNGFVCGEFDTEVILSATALLRATQCNQSAHMIALLLRLGADPNAEDAYMGRRAIGFAAWYCNVMSMRLLINKGASIDPVQGMDKETPLHQAALNGCYWCVRILLDNGAKIDAKTHKHYTALMLATQRSHFNVTRLLLERGANMEARNANGMTALIMAKYYPLAELLVEKGADVNAMPEDGFGPLISAIYDRNIKLVKLYLANGANIETRDRIYGRTPLIWAAARGQSDIVKLLLDKGANIDATDEQDNTALAEAENRGYSDTAWLLLEKLADWRQRVAKKKAEHIHLHASAISIVKNLWWFFQLILALFPLVCCGIQ